jgi:hypothetical protein
MLKNHKKADQVGSIIAIAFALAMLVFIYGNRNLARHNYIIDYGRITAISPPASSGGYYTLFFDYHVNGKIFNGNSKFQFCNKEDIDQIKGLLIGKQFPVVFTKRSPDDGLLLFNQKNADKYDYQLADSIKRYDSILTCK